MQQLLQKLSSHKEQLKGIESSTLHQALLDFERMLVELRSPLTSLAKTLVSNKLLPQSSENSLDLDLIEQSRLLYTTAALLRAPLPAPVSLSEPLLSILTTRDDTGLLEALWSRELGLQLAMFCRVKLGLTKLQTQISRKANGLVNVELQHTVTGFISFELEAPSGDTLGGALTALHRTLERSIRVIEHRFKLTEQKAA